MRLTLRTLLAYLDDILDPADAELLGKKIDESEFATSLVHQIRGSVRRLRLDAPALDAQGIGGELNSVAEYLDNVLPPDQVPALEKACLDSEINLGEVASCHQVLTLVLGEAAPVTDRMRNLAYDIAPTAPAAERSTADNSSDVPQIISHPPHPVVPPPASTMIVNPPSYPVGGDTSISVSAPSDAQSEQTTPGTQSSRTFVARIDGPSTKETWRAEASALQAETLAQSTAPQAAATVAAAATVGASVSPATTVTGPAARRDHPDYMPRKSSWLRSAFLTGIVALLILAGLLLATGTLRDNMLTRWLGQQQPVASNAPKTLEPISTVPDTPVNPTSQPNSASPKKLEIVSPNQQQPALESTALIPQDPSASLTPASEELPELFESDGFRNPTTPPTNPSTDLPSLAPENDTKVTQQPEVAVADSNNEQSAPWDGSFAREPGTESSVTNATSASTINQMELERAAEEDMFPPVSLATENQPIESTLPLEQPHSPTNDQGNGFYAETGAPLTDADKVAESGALIDATSIPEPTNSTAPDYTSSLADNPTNDTTASSVTDVTPSLSTTDRELEPSTVEPPVASPSSSASDLANSTRIPAELSAPEEMEADIAGTMEPTKLKRDDQLLLLFDNESKAWVRVDSTVQLKEDDHLLGLPVFKSEIEIGENMVCSIHGASRLRLGPGSDISILDGQVLLQNKQANQTQGIRFQGKRYEIRMIEPNSTVAIKAFHRHVPGADLTTAPHSVLRMDAMDYSITVSTSEQELEVVSGRHLLAVNDFAPQLRKTGRRPKWMQSDSLLQVDKAARREWKKALSDIADLPKWLGTMATKSRVNQRSLASRCLAEMDDFSACVASFGDRDQHAYWQESFNTLRRATTRGSEVQDLLMQELEIMHGSDQAELMMEMLRGYNQKQLASGGAARLVRYLAHPNIEIRALAIENLERITGKNLGFRAHESPGSRAPKVRSWQKRLSKGSIGYDDKPEIVTLLTSFVNAN